MNFEPIESEEGSPTPSTGVNEPQTRPDVGRRALMLVGSGIAAVGAGALARATAAAQAGSCAPDAIITVTDPPYNAPTDGTDATSAIQAAIDAAGTNCAGGGMVYFPPGDYGIANVNGLSLRSRVTLIGAGASSRLVAASSSPQHLLKEITPNAFVEDVRITNLTFVGNGASHKGIGLGAGLRLHKFRRVSVDHCAFENCGLGALFGAEDPADQSSDLDFSHNVIFCSPPTVCTWAITVRHIAGLLVQGNRFQRCCRALNVQLYQSTHHARDIVFANNLCRDGRYNGDGVIMAQVMVDVVYAGPTITNVTIGNNVFDGSSGAGGVGYPARDIFFEGYSKNQPNLAGVSIGGNVSRNMTGWGSGDSVIHVKWTENATITGNSIQNAQTNVAHGIHVEDAPRVCVSGNTIVGTNYSSGITETATVPLDNTYMANVSTAPHSLPHTAISRSSVLQPGPAGPTAQLDLLVSGYYGHWNTTGMTMP